MKITAVITGIFCLFVLVSCSSKSEIIPLRGSLETSLGKLEMVEKRTEIKINVNKKEKTIRPQNDETLYIFTFGGKNEISKGKDGFPLIDTAGNYYLPDFEGTIGTDGIPSDGGWVLNGQMLGKDGEWVFAGTIKLPQPQVTLVYVIPKSVKDLAFIDAIDQSAVYFIIGKAEKEFKMAMTASSSNFIHAEKTFIKYFDAARKGNMEEMAECLTHSKKMMYFETIRNHDEREKARWLDSVNNMFRKESARMEYNILLGKYISNTEIRLLIRTEYYKDESKTQSDYNETEWKVFKYELDEWKLESPYGFARRKQIDNEDSVGVVGGIEGGIIGGVIR